MNDSEGKEIEVFTTEEVEQQKTEATETAKTDAVEEFKKENPDKTEEMNELQTKLDDANADLEKSQEGLKVLENKDYGFDKVRKEANDKVEEAEGRVKELETSMDTKIGTAIGTAKKEILEDVMKDHYNETLKTLAGEDEEMKKKVEFHYARISDIAGTKEEMTKKLSDAYLLASRTEAPDALNPAVTSSGQVAPINVNKESQAFSPDEKDLAGKFGLTEDDLKKHGN